MQGIKKNFFYIFLILYLITGSITSLNIGISHDELHEEENWKYNVALSKNLTKHIFLDQEIDLEYETEYTYYVTASNGAGESGMSNEVQITTGLEPFDPIPPSGLAAFGMDEKVVLTWQEPQSFPDAVDCQGQEFDPFDPVYSSYDCLVCGLANDAGDICGEGLATCVDWLGDTFCDDGSFGFFFDCETFGCDCGDCGMECEDPYGFCDTVVSEIPDSKITGDALFLKV